MVAAQRVLARRSVRRAAVALGVVLAAEAAAFVVLVGRPHLVSARLLLDITGPLWVVAVALLGWLTSHCDGRRLAWLVLGVGAVFVGVAVAHPAATSDDAYRYVWDAKVQLHGVDPYRYTPASPQLARLRDPGLFGAPEHCQHPFPGGCTSINRPDVHTIYPPVAEGAFTLVRVASFGGHGGLRPLQIAGALGTLLIGGLLLRWAGGRPWVAAVWTWCPVPVVEYANNAHIDWLAVLFVVLAFATGAVRRTGWAGALIGAAVAVKLYPVLVLPSIMRRRPLLAVGAAAGLVVLVYVPHVLAVGAKVIGFLPGYLKQEDYASGGRLLLLGAVLPHPVDTIVGVLIVGLVALWAWRRGDPLAPANSAVLVVGVAFLVFTPSYGWYTGLLLALVAMTGALEWAPLCFAASFAFLDHGPHDSVTYLGAALLVAVIAVARRRFFRVTPSDDLGQALG